MHHGYCFLALNSVVFGVKMKEGSGVESFTFDEACVNGAGGLKF